MFDRIIGPILRFIRNMFPPEAETLNDFAQAAIENGNPIEIMATFEIQKSQNVVSDNYLFFTEIVGRRYFVRLMSTTRDGEQFIYKRFIGFLSAMSGPDEEKKLLEKTANQAKIIFERISMKWPDIRAKIVNT
ncbi:MAG: hypothetical protein WC788_00155 [Candidatus Paceibacterota bacterium]